MKTTTNERTKAVTINQKIRRLEQSIKLQERTRDNLVAMNAPTPEAIGLSNRIIAQLKAQVTIYEAQASEDRRLYKAIYGREATGARLPCGILRDRHLATTSKG